MFPVKSMFAAFAILFAAPVALSPAASAQDTKVVVIDSVKIYVDSLAGQDLRNKVAAIETQMAAELKPKADVLQSNIDALATKTEGMTPEAVMGTPVLRAEAIQVRTQAENFNNDRQVATQELSLTERTALVEFNNLLIPILEEVVSETGANIIMDKTQVTYVDAETDVSAMVIEKLNAASPTVNVVRQKLPEQPAQ